RAPRLEGGGAPDRVGGGGGGRRSAPAGLEHLHRLGGHVGPGAAARDPGGVDGARHTLQVIGAGRPGDPAPARYSAPAPSRQRAPGDTAGSVSSLPPPLVGESPRTGLEKETTMSIGLGIFLFVIGAILTFALNVQVDWVDLSLVGYLLMGAGVIVTIIGIALLVRRRQSVTTVRSDVDPATGARVDQRATETDPLP